MTSADRDFDNARERESRLDYAVEYMNGRLGDSLLTLTDWAHACDFRVSTMIRAFGRRYGTPPMHYLWSARCERAREMVEFDPFRPLVEIQAVCGFTSAAHFSRKMKDRYGECPANIRHAERQKLTRRMGA